MTACARCRDGISHEFKHGLRSGYQNHHCRCDACIEASRDYQARYREANPDRVRANYTRWREANSDSGRAYHHEYYLANRESEMERHREYYRANREYLRRLGKKFAAGRASIPGPNNGSRWTPDDDATVSRNDLSLTEICYILGRSYPAVRGRRERIQARRWRRGQLLRDAS